VTALSISPVKQSEHKKRLLLTSTMRIRPTLLAGVCLAVLAASCFAASTASTQPDSRLATDPIVLEQIDRVSLLAWKETLGPKYPLTVARADSITMILDFFNAATTDWHAQGEVTQTPMFAGFYRGQSLESERGFIEFSHGAGGLLLIRERGKLYSRVASPADIDRFLSFFGIGVVVIPN
jgi:hypothetical protein